MSKFLLTIAAMQVVALDALNEGIWVTEEALQNNENVLQANADAAATLQLRLTAANDLATALTAERDAHASTIATRDGQVATLQARVTELENSAPPPASTHSEADKTGVEKVYSWNDPKNPANAAADKYFRPKKA